MFQAHTTGGFVSVTEKHTILGEVITIPAKNPPVTAVAGLNEYEAAKELRTHARRLYEVPDAAVIKSLQKLETVLSKTRVSKAERLAAFKEVAVAVNGYNVSSRNSVARIRVLAQSLPTVPRLPRTPAENIVTAFVAILKSNRVIP